jgi:hypothetical protein
MTAFHYEILSVACPYHCVLRCGVLRRTATAKHSASRRTVSANRARGISSAATAIQSQRPRPAATARRSHSIASTHGCADEGCKGRLSLWNSSSWQTALGGKPLFARQVRRCGRISSGNGSERSLYRQNLSGTVNNLPLRWESAATAGFRLRFSPSLAAPDVR